MRPTRSTLAVTLALLGLLSAPAWADEMAAISDASDAARPFLVKVHADWCGTCTALNPTWDELETKLGDGARLVILDVTDRQTLQAAQTEAQRLGIDGFFDEYKARTGTIAVLRGDSRAKVEVMKGVTDVARYETAVALARSADPS